MAYEDYCTACTYMGESADEYGKYNCERQWDRVYACAPKCSRFCEAYRRSDSARGNMYDNSREHNSSGCYITTMLSSVLGLPDNNIYLNTLRNFRDNYMKKDENSQNLLLTYDIIGPLIAKKIQEDPKKETISFYCFHKYITKAVQEINEKKNLEAIKTYSEMTEYLIGYYNINNIVIYPNIDEIDKKYLGHGKVKKLVKENQTI